MDVLGLKNRGRFLLRRWPERIRNLCSSGAVIDFHVTPDYWCSTLCFALAHLHEDLNVIFELLEWSLCYMDLLICCVSRERKRNSGCETV